ncbi:MAG: M23 family metallopeptidase [Novosphingobium sp.]|nr:M23 family metallopeptidase [Novosphingobium sp.]
MNVRVPTILKQFWVQLIFCTLATGLAATSLGAQPLPAPGGGIVVASASPGQLPNGDEDFRGRMLDWDAEPTFERSVLQVEGERRLGLPLGNMARVSSGFGLRSDPLGPGLRFHAGVDLPGRAGSPVLATGGGVVAFAGWAGGYGNMVIIDHGQNVRTRYGHLLRLLVREGERVPGGTTIGLMGSTGRSTGNHLHYELRVGGLAVNPLGGSTRIAARKTSILQAWAGPAPLASAREDWTDPAADERLPTLVLR